MFDNLSDKLQRVFKNLRGEGKLSAENMETALKEIRLALLEALDRALLPLNVTSAQYVILSTLASGADSASQICKGISYDAGAMTRMIDRLEQRGLLQRVRVADDRRTVRLQLTDEGKALYPKMRASAVEVINGLLRGFTKAEARQLEDFLKRMLENA